MSENIPESIPTSQDPRSKRPLKKRALTPTTQQASQVSALLAKPDRDIVIPSSTALTKKSNMSAPPEIVANVQGSSAGAGSGEFHVYKASRRREYERVKMMDEDVAREKANEKFEKTRAEQKKRDEEKTEKNRRRREKLKKRKEGKDEGDDAMTKGVDQGNTNGGQVRVSEKEEGGKEDLSAAPAENVGVIIHDDD